MPAHELQPLLNVQQIMDRYTIADPRTARKLMRAAGAFAIAGRIVVYAEDLAAYEASKRAANVPAPQVTRSTRPRRNGLQQVPGSLSGDWWREDNAPSGKP